jgi:SMODS-associating 2TM, beta-strand rich effector domain
MINLFPITKVISWVAVVYASAVVLFALLLNVGGIAALGTAFKGVAVLNLVLLGVAIVGWKHIWRWVPKLNDWVFPNLNGKWVVDIHWNWGRKSGQKTANAFIKQSLLKISIELSSDESESETLLVVPHKDVHSSRPGLYYIYRNVGIAGAAKKQDPHIGAAILKVDQESNELLRGNYFTDRSTNGQYTMRRADEI